MHRFRFQTSLRMILTEPLAKFIDYGNAVFEGDKKSGIPVSTASLQQLRMGKGQGFCGEDILFKMVEN